MSTNIYLDGCLIHAWLDDLRHLTYKVMTVYIKHDYINYHSWSLLESRHFTDTENMEQFMKLGV